MQSNGIIVILSKLLKKPHNYLIELFKLTMRQESNEFELELDNIPLINLRNEFSLYHQAFEKEDFTGQFIGKMRPIKTPYMTWYGMPEDLLTLILQKVTVGVESYLAGATYIELGKRGRLAENIMYIRDPFKLKGRGTVENYYHLLPALVDESISLKTKNTELYNKTRRFYKQIRNPLFHGSQVSKRNVEGMKNILRYLAEIYEWIDGWFMLEKH